MVSVSREPLSHLRRRSNTISNLFIWFFCFYHFLIRYTQTKITYFNGIIFQPQSRVGIEYYVQHTFIMQFKKLCHCIYNYKYTFHLSTFVYYWVKVENLKIFVTLTILDTFKVGSIAVKSNLRKRTSKFCLTNTYPFVWTPCACASRRSRPSWTSVWYRCCAICWKCCWRLIILRPTPTKMYTNCILCLPPFGRLAVVCSRIRYVLGRIT